jgi:hypothetical protein
MPRILANSTCVIYLDYPTEVVEKVVCEALEYGLMDLKRIERMVLKNVAGEFFRLTDDRKQGG